MTEKETEGWRSNSGCNEHTGHLAANHRAVFRDTTWRTSWEEGKVKKLGKVRKNY